MISWFDTMHACVERTDGRQTELPWHIRAKAYAVARRNAVKTFTRREDLDIVMMMMIIMENDSSAARDALPVATVNTCPH